jgi:hypothetical protein
MVRTVFLISEQTPPAYFILTALTITVTSGLLIFFVRKMHNTFARRSIYVVLSIVCATALFTAIKNTAEALPFVFNSKQLNSAIQQYKRGDYVTFEGIVSEYQVNAKRTESCFRVDGNHVCTNMSGGPYGYRRDGSTSPVEDGMRVKVFYHEPVILRVDVMDE